MRKRGVLNVHKPAKFSLNVVQNCRGENSGTVAVLHFALKQADDDTVCCDVKFGRQVLKCISWGLEAVLKKST